MAPEQAARAGVSGMSEAETREKRASLLPSSLSSPPTPFNLLLLCAQTAEPAPRPVSHL